MSMNLRVLMLWCYFMHLTVFPKFKICSLISTYVHLKLYDNILLASTLLLL